VSDSPSRTSLPERNPPPDADLSIGDVAKATGIGPDTIRAWERRFGRPKPIRLPSGHRRYSRHDVRWLRRVAEALARGHRAGVVVPATEQALDALLGEAPDKVETPEVKRALDAVRAYRLEEVEAELDAAWHELETAAFLEERIVPLVRAVGRAWADGKLDIRYEHFLTEILEDFLRARRMALAVGQSGPAIVLGTLPGEEHGLGVQMAALVSADQGFTTHILGTETPVVEIASGARELHAMAVAISVTLITGGVASDQMLSELRRALPHHTTLLVGGEGARRGRRGVRGIVYLNDLHQLAAWLAASRRDGAA
jgi:DNA-binding transcriptional MerR regulator/methylmalonyl-CoA mutase cobalamin-binding subunit